MTAARRVGILGGTFDPIHCGHLDAGTAAQAALDLEELLVLPSNIPPHRPQPVASTFHRFAMVALAISGRPGWRALDLELRQHGPSYTWDSLHSLHDRGFHAPELFFVTGADAFLEIATWKHYPAVLNLAHFAVISRRGVPVGDLPARLPALAGRMRAVGSGRASSAVRDGTSDGGITSDAVTGDTVIFLIEASTADVSATAIRLALARRDPIAGMVPPSVRQHIEQHGLYQDLTAAADSGGGS